jgi:tape measure domain-containing protein
MAATLDASLRLDSSQFTSGLDGAMKNTNAAVSKMSATFSMLKNIAIGGAIGSAFVSVAKDITSTYIEAEKLQNALKATAGNDFLGMQQYEQLKKLSSEIGLNMGVAAKATLQLQAAGMSAATAFKTIRTLQNAIGSGGGGSEELGRFIYGLQQLYASPKPLAEELGQLKEALPVTAKLLTQAFGSARAEDLQKLNLSGKQVAETLLKMAEAMPKMERGLGGQIDAIKAKFDTLKEMTGESSSGFTKMLAGGLSAFLDYIIKKQNEIKANEEALSLKFLGSSVAIEDEDQRKLLRALDRQKAAEADSLKAAEDRKKLQEALDKGNQENRELDAIKWQNEERFYQEKAAREKQLQDDAKKAADQAKRDADELADKQLAAMRRLQGAQESVYANIQSMEEDPQNRLTQAMDALRELEGGELDGLTYSYGDAEAFAEAFEKLAKSGAELTEEQIEKYNKIMALRQEILGIERDISDETKNQIEKTKEQNRDAVQKSIDKAGRTPAERRQQMRDDNDMSRQRRRAAEADVRDEARRLKKEIDKANKERFIADRESTDPKMLKRQATANVRERWKDALPNAEAHLLSIKGILQQLAAA